MRDEMSGKPRVARRRRLTIFTGGLLVAAWILSGHANGQESGVPETSSSTDVSTPPVLVVGTSGTSAAQTEPAPVLPASPVATSTPPEPATAGAATSRPTPPIVETEVVITATRLREAGEIPSATSVLRAQDVAAAPSRATDETLRSVPAVTLPRTDSRSQHTTGQNVSIRGLGRGRTLVLADGIPLNDPFGGWIHWNKVPKSQIERIEVVRGASSQLYGNLAMGGVIQVFTKPTHEERLLLEGDYGMRDSPHLAAVASDRLSENVSAIAMVDVYRTDGYLTLSEATRGAVDRPAAFESQNAGAKVVWKSSPRASTFIAGNFYNDDRNAGTPLTPNSQWIADGAAGFDLWTERGSHWQGSLFGGHQYFDNYNSRVDPTRSSEVPALHQKIPVSHGGGSLLWSRGLAEKHILTAGIDARYATATNEEDVFDSTGAPVGTRSAGGQQTLLGGFAEWTYSPTRSLTVITGLRGDYWGDFTGHSVATDGTRTGYADRQHGAASPRVAAVYRITPGLALRGAGYTGFRAPNLNELYRGFFSGTSQVIPNPELGPERVAGGEIGADWNPRPELRVGTTGFVNQMFDRIETVTLDDTTRQRKNIAEARSHGGEVDIEVRPLRSLSLGAGYAFLVSEITSFPSNEALVGKTLPSIPRHQAVVSARWANPRYVDVAVRLRAESSQFADDQNKFELPAYTLLDASLAKRLRDFTEVFVSVSNAFDTQVVTDENQSLERIGTPRTVWGGFRVSY